MQRVAASSVGTTIAKSIRLLAVRAIQRCAGCATIRRLTKCLERVILRRHNDASSRQGSSRIISLGCVTVANNSPLFPSLLPTPDDASLMTTRRGGSSLRFAQFASCRVRNPRDRMHPHARAVVRTLQEIGHVDLDSVIDMRNQSSSSGRKSSNLLRVISRKDALVVVRYAMCIR